MRPIPGFPHVQYEAGPAADGRWLIECRCTGCGDRWHRPCDFPARTDEWIQRYLSLHFRCQPAPYPSCC